MNLIKKLLLAASALLALTVGSAGATDYTLTTDGKAAIAAPVAGSFTDYFTFTLSSPSDISGGADSKGFVISIFGTDITFLAVNFLSFSLLDGGSNIVTSGSPNTSHFSFSANSLSAGTYKLEVSGTSSGAPYGVALQAAAVPEPGEWAMILAGLGMVGVISRRRRSA